jgi:hypothetical protein
MPAQAARPPSRTTTILLNCLVLTATLFLAACRCKEGVKARAFVGHLTQDECLRKITEPEAPISIICPGTEITLCWGSNTDTNTITVSPDPGGQSGSYPQQGVLYLKPEADTEIEVRASDCAATKKRVMVVNEPTPALFDAHWDGDCEKLSYNLNPAFVDEAIRTTDVEALWAPLIEGGSACPMNSFLDGAHLDEPFFFSILNPFTLTPFSGDPHKAVGDWVYVMDEKCRRDFKCNKDGAFPFNMTLVCPSGL